MAALAPELRLLPVAQWGLPLARLALALLLLALSWAQPSVESLHRRHMRRSAAR
ncbi:hypothetical protein [Roseiflexus castenholzii]|uniref:hypothetical protein n=1 Tax=Roseiflexus castenholzii TaxID=120962 RepID=UPI001E2D48AB|nr:hypothetical protein [Roseiflexus castenholzii]